MTHPAIRDLVRSATALEDRALAFAVRNENERNAAVADLEAAARIHDSLNLPTRAAFCRSEAARLAAKTFA